MLFTKQVSRWIVIITLLSSLVWLSEGDKIWSGASSITAVQGQSVTMNWIVNLTSAGESKAWSYAKIIQVQDRITRDLVSLQKSGRKTIDDPSYQSRESDLTLNISQIGPVVTIMFTMQNLLRSSDEKHYKALLGFPFDSLTFPGATSLIIQVIPHSTKINTSPNKTSFCREDKLTITCTSRAHPTADYEFYRNNHLVQRGNNGVLVVSTTLADRVFNCVPYNTAGAGQNQSYRVHVKDPPKILGCQINDKNTTNGTVEEGSTVTLKCTLSGSEPMNVTWIQESVSDVPLPWSEQNLTLNSISRKEGGRYRMNVNNGKECNVAVTITFHLTVNYKPVGTSISVLQNQSTFCIEDKITVVCRTEANPPADFSFFQNKQLIGQKSKSGSFSVYLLVKGELNFECIPSNTLGRGESRSLRVFVKEPPSISNCKANNHNLKNITVNQGTKVTFKCEFSGSEPLDVTWTKESKTNVLTRWNQRNLTFSSVHRNDNGFYRVTVYNGRECNTTVNRTFRLTVNYINKVQVIGKNYRIFNKSSASVWFEVLLDAYPDATLTCQSDHLSRESVVIHGSKKGPTKMHFNVTINTTKVEQNLNLKCTSENKAGSQTTGFLLYRQVAVKKAGGAITLLGQEWHTDFSNVNTEIHKNLREKCMKMLHYVYHDVAYVIKWDVLRFTRGSVVMYFDLYMVANVHDPLLTLRLAVESNGGFIGDLQIDPTSVKNTDDVKRCKQCISNDSKDVIVAVVGVFFAVSLVVNVVFIVLLFKGKVSKDKHGEGNNKGLGHQRKRMPIEKRSSDQGSQEDGYDYPYNEVGCKMGSMDTSSPNAEAENPSMNILLSEMNENQELIKDNSPNKETIEETNETATPDERPLPALPDGNAQESSSTYKPYNLLSAQIPKERAGCPDNYNSFIKSTKLSVMDQQQQKGPSETNEIQDDFQNKTTSEKERAEIADERPLPDGNDQESSTNKSYKLLDTQVIKEKAKNYNSLSSSTKLPTRNNRPSLEQTGGAQKAPIVKHEYLNNEMNKSSCDSQDVDSLDTTNESPDDSPN